MSPLSICDQEECARLMEMGQRDSLVKQLHLRDFIYHMLHGTRNITRNFEIFDSLPGRTEGGATKQHKPPQQKSTKVLINHIAY